jgi:hypothetical protein
VLFIVVYVMSFQGGGGAVKTFILGVDLQQESDGRWSVWVPERLGCASWVHIKEEALHNIRDAVEVYVEI